MNPFSGHWGPPTSSVDWCEANYAVTPWVCEWWNTVSSVAMVLAGLYGVSRYWRVLERRFLAAFGLLAVVGLGSIAFHGTLHFELQMLDELPMLYLVVLIVYTLVELRPGRRFGRWFPALLIAYVVGVTLANTLARGRAQFFTFHFSFGSLEVFSLASVYLLHRRTTDPDQRRAFRLGMGAYALAVSIWFVDLLDCPLVSVTLPFNPQLHAVWHVLVSYGFFTLLLVIAANRARLCGRPERLALRRGLLPKLRSSEPRASP